MATIQIIDNIRLNQKGLQTKDSNNQWVNVHKQQGGLSVLRRQICRADRKE